MDDGGVGGAGDLAVSGAVVVGGVWGECVGYGDGYGALAGGTESSSGEHIGEQHIAAFPILDGDPDRNGNGAHWDGVLSVSGAGK